MKLCFLISFKLQLSLSCLKFCDPMECSMPGFPVHNQSPELAHTYVHRVGDAVQPSHLAVRFTSHLQSFPASGSFPASQFVGSGGQSIGLSASASVLPMNIQDCFPLGWTGLISLQSRQLSESSSTPQFKRFNSLTPSFLCSPILTSMYDSWKNHRFD